LADYIACFGGKTGSTDPFNILIYRQETGLMKTEIGEPT